MVTPAGHDEQRAAAALLAIAASDRTHPLRAAAIAAVLGDGLDDRDRCAAIARILAAWLAQVLRDGGTDPRWFARQAIAGSIAAEAAQAAEDPP